MEKSEVGKVMDTIMSIPGMNEMVKIDFKISRKNALLLSSVIERGLDGKNEGGIVGMPDSIGKENLEELKELATDCLRKAGLMELSEKLKSLKGKP